MKEQAAARQRRIQQRQRRRATRHSRAQTQHEVDEHVNRHISLNNAALIEEPPHIEPEALEKELAKGMILRLPLGPTAMVDTGALGFETIDAIAHEDLLKDDRIRWRWTDARNSSIVVADQRCVEKDSRVALVWVDDNVRPLRTIITKTLCKSTPWQMILTMRFVAKFAQDYNAFFDYTTKCVTFSTHNRQVHHVWNHVDFDTKEAVLNSIINASKGGGEGTGDTLWLSPMTAEQFELLPQEERAGGRKYLGTLLHLESYKEKTRKQEAKHRLPECFKKHELTEEQATLVDQVIAGKEAELREEFPDIIVDDLEPGVSEDETKFFHIDLINEAF